MQENSQHFSVKENKRIENDYQLLKTLEGFSGQYLWTVRTLEGKTLQELVTQTDSQEVFTPLNTFFTFTKQYEQIVIGIRKEKNIYLFSYSQHAPQNFILLLQEHFHGHQNEIKLEELKSTILDPSQKSFVDISTN